MTDKKVERRNVSMYPDQWALVDRIDEQHHLNNTSAALRYIIADWHFLKYQLPLMFPNGENNEQQQ